MKKTHQVGTEWKGKVAFHSRIKHHTVKIDAAPELGDDTGPNPKPLLLSSLAGCTGMDVVELLRKMRVPFDGLDIDISAELTDEQPQVYSHIQLTYNFYGPELEAKREKVEKAVRLSQEELCGVTAMLKKNCPVEYTIELYELKPGTSGRP